LSTGSHNQTTRARAVMRPATTRKRRPKGDRIANYIYITDDNVSTAFCFKPATIQVTRTCILEISNY
jgi:hypothetical protein